MDRFRWNINESIAAEIRTNWSGFEPDPDHSSDPGTGFTPDFCTSVEYLKKLRTDFDEILCIGSYGGTKYKVHVFARVFLPLTTEKVHVFARVRLFVCLSVCWQDYLQTRPWIWINCSMLTDVGTWTNWFLAERNYVMFGWWHANGVSRLSSVCLSSVTFVHPTQMVKLFGNFFYHTVAQSF